MWLPLFLFHRKMQLQATSASPAKHSKQAGLLRFSIGFFLIPGQRGKRNDGAHPLVERPADGRGMHFIWTVAKHIQGYTFVEPLCQLLCPLLKKWFVDFHAGMTDVAQEDKVSGLCNLQRKIGFAFARLKYLP